ncbi:MAG: hypothetical protein AB7O65_10545 [Candidatus Korobacteraceae bacterium]
MRIVLPCLCLFLSSFVNATTVIPMSVEELTHAAARVVEGEVVGSWSAWNAERSAIYTYSRVRITRALKGGVEPEIIVQQLGGSAEGYTLKVAGVRGLERGERAMLFLRPARATGGAAWTIVGLMQGHFRVYAAGGQPRVSNGLQVRTARGQASTAVAESLSTSSFSGGVPSMTLQELESRVREALAE